LSFSAVPPVTIQGVVCKASHVFKSSILSLFNSYASLLDPGQTVEIAFWMTEQTKSRVFLLVSPELGRLGELLGDGVSQPTSSGSPTAPGTPGEGRKTREKPRQKARVRAGRTKVRTQSCDAKNTNVSSYYSLVRASRAFLLLPVKSENAHNLIFP